MKFFTPLVLVLTGSALPFTDALPQAPEPHLPTKVIAGVEVPYTPLIADSIAYARANSDNMTFNHIMRSFLFASLHLASNTSLTNVDREVTAVGAILHDLGLDTSPNSTIVSKHLRFEVDGAIAARKFIRNHPEGKKWDERRVQLVWDGIALHAEHQISWNKELEVQAISLGIMQDFDPPSDSGGPVSRAAHEKIVAEFPGKDTLLRGIMQRVVWLCQTKPEGTYDTWMEPFGKYTKGYSAKGKRMFDMLDDMYGSEFSS